MSRIKSNKNQYLSLFRLLAFAVGVSFWALAQLGFNAEGENAPQALTHFRWLMGALPVLSGVGVILTLWKFPIGAQKQRELRDDLHKRTPNKEKEQVSIKGGVT